MLKFTELKKMDRITLMEKLRELRQEMYDINEKKLLQKYKGDLHQMVKLKRQIAKVKHVLSNLQEK